MPAREVFRSWDLTPTFFPKIRRELAVLYLNAILAETQIPLDNRRKSIKVTDSYE
jgi:hypothetical protein